MQLVQIVESDAVNGGRDGSAPWYSVCRDDDGYCDANNADEATNSSFSS